MAAEAGMTLAPVGEDSGAGDERNEEQHQAGGLVESADETAAYEEVAEAADEEGGGFVADGDGTAEAAVPEEEPLPERSETAT
jgi:hypothetical protein